MWKSPFDEWVASFALDQFVKKKALPLHLPIQGLFAETTLEMLLVPPKLSYSMSTGPVVNVV